MKSIKLSLAVIAVSLIFSSESAAASDGLTLEAPVSVSSRFPFADEVQGEDGKQLRVQRISARALTIAVSGDKSDLGATIDVSTAGDGTLRLDVLTQNRKVIIEWSQANLTVALLEESGERHVIRGNMTTGGVDLLAGSMNAFDEYRKEIKLAFGSLDRVLRAKPAAGRNVSSNAIYTGPDDPGLPAWPDGPYGPWGGLTPGMSCTGSWVTGYSYSAGAFPLNGACEMLIDVCQVASGLTKSGMCEAATENAHAKCRNLNYASGGCCHLGTCDALCFLEDFACTNANIDGQAVRGH